MRPQPRVKRTIQASSAASKARPPQMRSSMNGQPAKKLSELLIQAKPALEAELLQKPILTDGAITLFFSFSDGLQRATVVHFTGQHLNEVWKKLADWQQRKLKTSPQVRWLRIDWVTKTRAMTWADCQIEMQNVKRNYFRYGIALDTQLRRAFLEQELNANAMLYLGARQPKAALNKKNFLNYGVRRYGKHFSLPSPKDPVLLFTTRAILVQPGQPHELLHDYSGGKEGRNTGRRVIEKLDPEKVTSLIQQSSQFLADQVNAEGRFTYGIHPCFDREIKAYNTLRHASTTYAMLEAWEVTKSSDLKSSIDRSIQHLTNKLIRQYALHSGELVAYLQDSNNEIKLGGNAVCLLALVKYTELTKDNQHLPLMEQLALGIQRMQNPQNGQFYHVLNADDLSIKEEFRIIYYDGEAAFGLMRLYGLTKDERWLNTVEKAFEYFIEKEHWKIHDHWLSYCVNELTLYRPEERYYQFGIKNVAGHLDFVIGRITTFPTLLELMMAAHKMITRLEASNQHRHLLEQIDLKKFYRALEARAHYLLNGFFWPEFAIYFQNPQRIMGSFFIRHHSFRVRIDDVEHYLSGYVAYLMYYLKSNITHNHNSNQPRHWNAYHLAKATGGNWLQQPKNSWHAQGVKYYKPTVCKGDLVIVRGREEKAGVLPSLLSHLPAPAGFMLSADTYLESREIIEKNKLPILKVENTSDAILDIGRYARNQINGVVIGITGSSGKTTAVAMMADALKARGDVYVSEHNANLPHGIAWNLSTANWDTPHLVLEMAVGKMMVSSKMARPNISVFLNVHPAHIGKSHTTEDIARAKSGIFSGMSPGGIAVINRDMQHFDIAFEAATNKKQNIILFGEHKESNIRLIKYDSNSKIMTFTRDEAPAENMHIGAAGYHMALNSLAVIAVITALNYPLPPVLERLKNFSALPGRGEEKQICFNNLKLTLINDAYNANPGSMTASLKQLGERFTKGRRIAVLGQMEELGDSSEAYHTALASIIKQSNIDSLYLVGEKYQALWEQLPEGQQGAYADSIEDLKIILKNSLQDEDCVLVKGSNSTGIHKIVNWFEENQKNSIDITNTCHI